MQRQRYKFYVKQENIFGIICFSAKFIATQQRKKWRKVWNITGNCLSLQRERWNQVEPRCAERWHGCGDAEMMSNSTLPLGFLHLNIELTTRGQFFYILLYLGSVNSAGSLILVAVIKFTNLTTSRFTFI